MTQMMMTALAASLLMSGAVLAEPVTGDAAKGLVHPVDAAQVQIISGGPLTADEAKLVASVVADQPYFGAIAVSPDEKLLESKATIAVANFHTTEAAAAEAVRQCDALRTGAAPCVVAAVIRPAGWQKGGALSLSSEATAGFLAKYPGAGGALAVSRTTGAWGLASGQGAGDAAVKACEAKPGAGSCAVVIAD